MLVLILGHPLLVTSQDLEEELSDLSPVATLDPLTQQTKLKIKCLDNQITQCNKEIYSNNNSNYNNSINNNNSNKLTQIREIIRKQIITNGQVSTLLFLIMEKWTKRKRRQMISIINSMNIWIREGKNKEKKKCKKK